MTMTEGITDPTSPTPGDVIVQIDIGQIEPCPTNRISERVDDLAKSIAEVGILEPLIVRPHPHGASSAHELVAGERRWRAACTVGLTTVPCIVRDVTDDQAAEIRLIENLQREELTPLDEAAAYAELLAYDGWTQRRVAERVGVNQSHVSRRLALLDLPEKAQRALDAGDITVHEAQALTKLLRHPKKIDELLKRAKKHYEDPATLVDDVDEVLTALERETAKRQLAQDLEAKGVTVIDKRLGWDHKLGTYGDVHVDAKKHAKEPCHRVYIGETWKANKMAPEPEEYCADPKRHTKTGASELKATRPSSSASPGKSTAVKKREAAEREASRQRRAALTGLLGRKVPGDFWQRIARRYIDDAAHDERQKMCQLLGLGVEAEKDRYGSTHRDYGGAIDRYAAQSDAHLQQTAFAFYLVQGEWGHRGHAAENRELLLAAGYEPHPAEKANFTKATKATKR